MLEHFSFFLNMYLWLLLLCNLLFFLDTGLGSNWWIYIILITCRLKFISRCTRYAYEGIKMLPLHVFWQSHSFMYLVHVFKAIDVFIWFLRWSVHGVMRYTLRIFIGWYHHAVQDIHWANAITWASLVIVTLIRETLNPISLFTLEFLSVGIHQAYYALSNIPNKWLDAHIALWHLNWLVISCWISRLHIIELTLKCFSRSALSKPPKSSLNVVIFIRLVLSFGKAD